MNIFEDFENEKYNYVQSNIVSTKILDQSGNVSRSMFYDGSVYQDSIGLTLSMDKFCKCTKSQRTGLTRCREEDFSEIRTRKSLIFMNDRHKRMKIHR